MSSHRTHIYFKLMFTNQYEYILVVYNVVFNLYMLVDAACSAGLSDASSVVVGSCFSDASSVVVGSCFSDASSVVVGSCFSDASSVVVGSCFSDASSVVVGSCSCYLRFKLPSLVSFGETTSTVWVSLVCQYHSLS